MVDTLTDFQVTLHAKITRPDSLWHPLKLCLAKHEWDINVKLFNTNKWLYIAGKCEGILVQQF